MKNGRYEEYRCVVYYKNDLIHREDGPALIRADGSQAWLAKGERHRLDGPAVISSNGHQEWYVEGKLHRLDGPAIIGAKGSQRWFVNGEELTEEEFLAHPKCMVGKTISSTTEVEVGDKIMPVRCFDLS